MATRIKCDACPIEIDVESWNGFQLVVDTEQGCFKFHLCKECQDKLNSKATELIRKFMRIEGEIYGWGFQPGL